MASKRVASRQCRSTCLAHSPLGATVWAPVRREPEELSEAGTSPSVAQPRRQRGEAHGPADETWRGPLGPSGDDSAGGGLRSGGQSSPATPGASGVSGTPLVVHARCPPNVGRQRCRVPDRPRQWRRLFLLGMRLEVVTHSSTKQVCICSRTRRRRSARPWGHTGLPWRPRRSAFAQPYRGRRNFAVSMVK
jgi:hypothetical protein